jgi:release factor glutamine methyltransferase
MKIADALKKASERLQAAGVAYPRREASSLLSFVLGESSAYIIAHSEDQLAANQKIIFDSCVRRRADREPLQYITGRQEFWGLEIEVTPDVLIPRPETEILVAAAIEILSKADSPRFCEVGVGSGCLSVAILYSIKGATAVATDVSTAALRIAGRNAAKHGVDQRLDTREADLFEGIDERFDVIVSNPPYIPDGELENLQPEVRDHEPREALAGGLNGLGVVERIATGSPRLLRPGGCLLMEIGHDQARRVANVFDKSTWGDIEFLRDLQSIDRVVRAWLK